MRVVNGRVLHSGVPRYNFAARAEFLSDLFLFHDSFKSSGFVLFMFFCTLLNSNRCTKSLLFVQ